MEEFAIRLNNVSDSYCDFVAAVLTYVNNKPERLVVVSNYMDQNPSAETSDILAFISSQPDFYEDSAVHSPA